MARTQSARHAIDVVRNGQAALQSSNHLLHIDRDFRDTFNRNHGPE
jgi:hypothetical protein